MKASKGVLSVAVGMLLIAGGDRASAQGPAVRDAEVALQEVVVTAKGRVEDVQDVPLAITVVSAEQILQRTIQDARDLVNFAPSITFYSGSGRADLTALVVRGLSPQTSDERYQGLSFFVDGIAISGQLAGLDLSQVERVEIIKGPQSAKFGRATYSGAVDYVTRTPRPDSFEAAVRMRVSDHGDDSDISKVGTARLALPVVDDRLWLALNGVYSDIGGRARNAGTDPNKLGEEKTRAIGVTLFSQLSDNATLKLRYTLDKERDTPSLLTNSQPTDWLAAGASNLFTVTNPNPVVALCGTTCGQAGSLWIRGEVAQIPLGLVGTDVGAIWAFTPRDFISGGGRRREREFVSALYANEFANGWEISYRGGWFDQTYWALEDFRGRARFNDPTFGPLGISGAPKSTAFLIAFQESFKNTSHQLRLKSADDARLRWMIGAYYFEEDNLNSQWVRANPATPATAPITSIADITFRRTRGLEWFDNRAVFGELAYDVTDKLTLTAEGSYQREVLGYDACTTCGTVNPIDRRFTEKDFLPRVTAEYQWSDDVLTYAYWSRGTKSGRVNTSAGAFNFAYRVPEELDNIELGVKTRLRDGRAILNASIFQQDVKNQQLLTAIVNPACTTDPMGVVTCPPGLFPTLTGLVTAGDSEIWGAEVQAAFALTENWRIDGALGYARHKFVDDIGPFPAGGSDPFLFAPGETLKGKTSINSPRVTGNLGVAYERAVRDGAWTLSARADAIHTGKKYVDIANVAYIGAVTRINLRAGLSDRDQRWDAALFVRDLTDEQTALGAGLTGSSSCYFREPPTGTQVVSQRCLSLSVPRGREIGIEFGFNF